MAAQDPESDRVTELFDELATIGATRPDELLTVVSKSINLLTKNTGIYVNKTNTGRQLEFVLLPITDQTYSRR
jgi:flagellar motor switch protein FliG